MKILADLDLAAYSLQERDLVVMDKTLVVVKRDWNYLQALAFQEVLCERVALYKDERAFIFCSHPFCLTLGRGLQRNKQISTQLIDFDPALESQLGAPLYHVGRGGGLTFHYPGQLVFYPILSLESHHLKIHDLLQAVLRIFAKSLAKLYNIDDINHERDLLGLWAGDRKLASIGVMARRFVSFHGLALNIQRDENLAKTLGLVYPCGLSGSTYTYLEDFITPEQRTQCFDQIQKTVLPQFLDWKVSWDEQLIHRDN